jgi:hypothetical protein
MSAAAATWVPINAFHAAHPSLQFEDELFVEEGEVLWTTTSIKGVADGRAKPDATKEADGLAGPGRDAHVRGHQQLQRVRHSVE